MTWAMPVTKILDGDGFVDRSGIGGLVDLCPRVYSMTNDDVDDDGHRRRLRQLSDHLQPRSGGTAIETAGETSAMDKKPFYLILMMAMVVFLGACDNGPNLEPDHRPHGGHAAGDLLYRKPR